MEMMYEGRETVNLGIRGERVPVGSHIAYFWENQKDFSEGMRFLVAGARDGDGVVVFGHPAANDLVLGHLTAQGVDVERAQANGKLVVLGGGPSGESMLGEIGGAFQKMMDGGARLIRLLGNIGWGREGWPMEAEILAFEAKVTGAAKTFPCVVVCMYDVQSLSGRLVLHGALATHPITICGNVLRHNPYYEEMESFLGRRKASGE